MILIDANLLVYAYIQELPQHEQARTWLEKTFQDSPRIGLPWPSLLTFLRLVSNPKIFQRPVPVPKAWGEVHRWLDLSSVWIPMPTERHAEIFGDWIAQGSLINRCDLIPDAHLAALAMEHGLKLFSTDSDFARFPDLRWQNPLTS